MKYILEDDLISALQEVAEATADSDKRVLGEIVRLLWAHLKRHDTADPDSPLMLGWAKPELEKS